MKDRPTVTARAQQVGLNDNSDLMIFEHFVIMRRTREGS
jgi:hypothetical protein